MGAWFGMSIQVCLEMMMEVCGGYGWGGDMDGLTLESGLMYRLMRRKISMAKSCIDGERVWFSMGV